MAASDSNYSPFSTEDSRWWLGARALLVAVTALLAGVSGSELAVMISCLVIGAAALGSIVYDFVAPYFSSWNNLFASSQVPPLDKPGFEPPLSMMEPLEQDDLDPEAKFYSGPKLLVQSPDDIGDNEFEESFDALLPEETPTTDGFPSTLKKK